MAIQHMDNFSIYGTSTSFMDDGVYAQANGVLALETDPDGLSGGRVLRSGSSAANRGTLRYVLSAPTQTMGAALRVWCSPLPEADNIRPVLASWRNGSNTEVASLTITTTGAIEFDDGTNTITTTGPVVTANAWWHIEYKYDRSGIGSIEVRVEGIEVMNDADLGYSSASDIAQVALQGGGSNFSSTGVYFKDYVIWDTTGSYNNDFLGSVLVTNLTPTADVALNWSPSSGSTGYEILDNIPPVDSTYLQAGDPAPSPYVCELSDLPVDVTSVKALMTFVRAAKSDGGDGSLQVSVISNGDTANGADRPITVAQTYWRDVFDTDPDTAAPWTPSAVDAAQLQLNRTT